MSMISMYLKSPEATLVKELGTLLLTHTTSKPTLYSLQRNKGIMNESEESMVCMGKIAASVLLKLFINVPCKKNKMDT